MSDDDSTVLGLRLDDPIRFAAALEVLFPANFGAGTIPPEVVRDIQQFKENARAFSLQCWHMHNHYFAVVDDAENPTGGSAEDENDGEEWKDGTAEDDGPEWDA